MKCLNAKFGKIKPHSFFSVSYEIDASKVAALVDHFIADGKVPPVVVVKYGDEHMPIDGHHRLSAAEQLDITLDAWIVPGDKFETLDELCRMRDDGKRAEDLIFCDGVPALQVATKEV